MLHAIVAGCFSFALLASVDPPASQAPPAPSAPPARAAGQLRGAISYGRNTPAVGAIVVVRPEGTPSPVRIATTGTNGRFAFDGVPDGVYRAEARRDGYMPVVKSGITVRAPFRAVVEVLLARGEGPREEPTPVEGGASLAGSIRVVGGAPLAEARVRLTRSDGADDSRTSLTDATGAVFFPGLKAGRWRLEAQGAGLLPLRAELDLVGDVAFEAQLAAQPANHRPLPQDLIVPEDVIPPPEP